MRNGITRERFGGNFLYVVEIPSAREGMNYDIIRL